MVGAQSVRKNCLLYLMGLGTGRVLKVPACSDWGDT